MSLVDQWLEDHDAILDDLSMHLVQAQERMKLQTDIKCHHEELKAGDLVFLELKPFS